MIIFLLLGLTTSYLYSQDEEIELYGISATWDDSYREWIIYTADEDIEGELELRWGATDNWKEWEYELEEEYGTIKMKWHNDPSQWEVRGDGEIITMKTKWRGDFTEWRISDGTINLTLRSKFKTHLEEWELSDDKYGKFEMYTTYERDVRDWEIIDELNEEISFPMKMALLFTVMYHTTPKL